MVEEDPNISMLSNSENSVLVVAGNQAELYHVAYWASHTRPVVLVRPPRFGFLDRFLGLGSIRSRTPRTDQLKEIEVGHLLWLIERLTAKVEFLRFLHPRVLMACFAAVSKKAILIEASLNPRHVVANYAVAHPLLSLRKDTVLNFPIALPGRNELSKWEAGYSASEKEAFLGGDAMLRTVRAELSQAANIVCGSKYAAQSLMASGVEPQKVRVLNYGIETGLFNFNGNCAPRSKSILFVGPKTYRKGGDIVESLLHSQVLMSEVERFTIVGRGWAAVGQSFEGSQVEFREKISQSELASLYKTHKFVIMPSRMEGMGLVGLEAQACGCVPIVSDKGPDEYVTDGETGFVLKDLGFSVWEKKLTSLMRDNASVSEIQMAGALSASRRSWEYYSRDYIRIAEN